MTSWRDSRWKRAQAAAIAALGYPVIAALGGTLRWRVSGLQHFDAIRAAGHQPVMAFWHGRILPATFYFRRRASSSSPATTSTGNGLRASSSASASAPRAARRRAGRRRRCCSSCAP
jgi:hypothetical protein